MVIKKTAVSIKTLTAEKNVNNQLPFYRQSSILTDAAGTIPPIIQ